jgi:hypothetical protein
MMYFSLFSSVFPEYAAKKETIIGSSDIRFLSENLKGKDHSEDLDVDGRIILE